MGCTTSHFLSFLFFFSYLISISVVSRQLLEHMLRPLAKIYPMEWRSVLVDFGTPPTEHLFIRVSFCSRLACVSEVKITLISQFHKIRVVPKLNHHRYTANGVFVILSEINHISLFTRLFLFTANTNIMFSIYCTKQLKISGKSFVFAVYRKRLS